MFNFSNCKRIIAKDIETGDQYIIGTTTVLRGPYERRESYEYYTFNLDDVSINRFTGKPTFEVTRCRSTIGNQETMELIFE